jgi:hypothetical protein
VQITFSSGCPIVLCGGCFDGAVKSGGKSFFFRTTKQGAMKKDLTAFFTARNFEPKDYVYKWQKENGAQLALVRQQ